jgi:hypothetical protein
MAQATQAQIDTYMTDIRSAICDFGEALAIKEKIGNQDIYCDKLKLMLLSGFLDCMSDYLLQYPDDEYPDDTNFFTTDQIRDVQQHINNICGTFYILEL